MNNEKPSGAKPTQKQQRAGDGKPEQIGEGSYEGTRNYQKSIGAYLEGADVSADAQAAQPADEAEARALKDAEKEGRSHAKAKGQ